MEVAIRSGSVLILSLRWCEPRESKPLGMRKIIKKNNNKGFKHSVSESVNTVWRELCPVPDPRGFASTLITSIEVTLGDSHMSRWMELEIQKTVRVHWPPTIFLNCLCWQW